MNDSNKFEIQGREWWVERWLELLDSYRFKKRLERGRNYAREGNVLSIEFAERQVFAKVQGSEAEPYQVALSLEPFPDENRERIIKIMSQKPFTDEDWECIIQTMSKKAIYTAQLLAGEMPANIEEVFTANGLSLFPYTLSDVRSRCSCPDKANPCKHIAAVYYQLGDRFSEDPFVIFQLRGRTKEEILEALRAIRSQNSNIGDRQPSTNLQEDERQNLAANQLASTTSPNSAEIKTFWQYDEPLESSLVVIVPPSDNKTVFDLLGKIPLPTDDADAVKEYLTQVYQTTSQQAIISALS
ncbi:MAG: SWIM zinc finger family protein [Xenococcaceae cyanobacterium MO_188.B29]|nr:SWIM zinc finger family protein [Xenococcaceae cyanobacterium MO_188.B29]